MTQTVRALLLTDVVDSTRLSEELGDARMAELWSAHDRAARTLLRKHGGREIDKTDGFLLLFEETRAAIAYAMAYHAALEALAPPLRARAGLHVGAVLLTENAPEDVALGAKPLEVDGIAKPTAARVMSVATGGQTLLTGEALDALGSHEWATVSHGHWRMKGVTEPVELFEVGADASLFAPPPDGPKAYRVVERSGTWLPRREVPHNLPAERDAFVGRIRDLAQIDRRFEQTRLLSLLGIGGTGKTRTAVRFGWTRMGAFPGGVVFVDLSEARDLVGAAAAVGAALDVPLLDGEPVAQLGAAIAARGTSLLILDNFEQIASLAPELIGPWLDAAPLARILVTTREVLGLPGESSIFLAPLSREDAVALFHTRAGQVHAGYRLGAVEPSTIDDLVELLDRLPLALELAAARVRVMPPARILERLSERFRLLTSGGRRQSRHATLRATLDWSWDLLSDEERLALAQLSVFEGGFTLEAVESVLELAEGWPMDVLQTLVDKSLVRVVEPERFDLLVSVQEYASERLDQLGQTEDARARHGLHFAGMGSRERLERDENRTRIAELENLLAANRRARLSGASGVAVATAMAAEVAFRAVGPLSRADEMVMETLSIADKTTPRCSVLYERSGQLKMSLGQMDAARQQLDAALALARAAGDRVREAMVITDLGSLLSDLGQLEEGVDHYRAAIAMLCSLGHPFEGTARNNLAVDLTDLGELDEAEEQLNQCLHIARATGDTQAEHRALAGVRRLLSLRGHQDEAKRMLEAALARSRESGDRAELAITLVNVGVNCLDSGRIDEAEAHLLEAIDLLRMLGHRRHLAIAHVNLGGAYRRGGALDRAREHFHACLDLAVAIGDRRLEAHVLGSLGRLALKRGEPERAREHFDRAESAARGASQGRTLLASLLASRGELALSLGERDEARRLALEARDITLEAGVVPDGSLVALLDALGEEPLGVPD